MGDSMLASLQGGVRLLPASLGDDARAVAARRWLWWQHLLWPRAEGALSTTALMHQPLLLQVEQALVCGSAPV